MEAVQLTLDNSRTYFLVCGIVNLIAGAVWTFLTLFTGLATCGLGCLLAVFPLIHLSVAVFDFIAVSKITSPPTPQTYSFLKLTSILDMIAGPAVVPLVLGILNLQILARPEIHAHFHQAQS